MTPQPRTDIEHLAPRQGPGYWLLFSKHFVIFIRSEFVAPFSGSPRFTSGVLTLFTAGEVPQSRSAVLDLTNIGYRFLAILVSSVLSTAMAQRIQIPPPPAAGSGDPPSSSANTVTPSAPHITPPVTSGPPATFNGTVTPTWDPYHSGTSVAPSSHDPYTTTPPTNFPYSPQATYGGPPPARPYGTQAPNLFSQGGPFMGAPEGFRAPAAPDGAQRLVQEIRFENTWMASNGGDKRLGWNELELSSTLAFPFFYNTQSPLFVTPGFAINWVSGPVSNSNNQWAELPPRLYDAYLDLGWKPQVTPWLSADLGFRTGVYSDFSKFDTRSLRFMGRAIAVLSFTPATRVALGVVYLDRNRIKLLPAGGIIWNPNPDTRFNIVFPNPKLARRMWDVGTTEWWWYVAGEYGGGAWTIKRVGPSGMPYGQDSIDYNDLRVMFGLDYTAANFQGFFEIGFVFDREIVYTKFPPSTFKPNDTVMLRGGLLF